MRSYETHARKTAGATHFGVAAAQLHAIYWIYDASGYQPGEAFLYSNYGYALLGLIVEETVGIPFDQHVTEQIFKPLGMAKSHYLLAPPIPEQVATGYAFQDGEQIAQPIDYDGDYPGGSIVSTAEEMGHFITALLRQGCYKGTCILQAETLAEMMKAKIPSTFKGQNWAYGFIEGFEGSQRMIGHGGAIRGFGSHLNLFPEHDIGCF